MAVALAVVSLGYEIILRPRELFNIQHHRFMQSDVAPEIVFLGDSRVLDGLHHGSMDRNFFNYAHPGEAPYGLVLRGRHVLREKPSVRVLVIQLDPYTVAGQRTLRPLPASRGFYEAILFSGLDDINQVIAPSRRELWTNIAAFVFPVWLWWERADFWGATRQALTAVGIDHAAPPARHLNACGDNVFWPAPDWQAVDGEERANAAQEQVRNRYLQRSFDPDLGRMIKELIAYSMQRGIKVIGLLMPETREFREAAAGHIDPLAEQFAFSLGIPVLDYRATFEGQPDMFTDTDHLKDAAAATFSRRVARDIRGLIDVAAAPEWNCSAEFPPFASFGVAIRRAILGRSHHG